MGVSLLFTFLAFLVPSCSLSQKMLIFDHVSPPASTHPHTLNQSLVVPSRYTQGRAFQPIAWVISHLWLENSLITCNSQIEVENARSLREKC